MNLLKEYIQNILSEAITQLDKIENLQPDDILTVYHGTGASYLEMVHGIDATKEQHRSYGGPRHSGLFITTDPETALRFASYGEVVLEIEVLAKNLYGTDYSGRTAKHQVSQGMPSPNDIWRDKYPNSFRPYLTATLLQKSEPQALLVGVVKPTQIKRVQYKGKWYSREELLDAQPEYHKPYERKPTKLKRISFDPTDESISIDNFIQILSSELGMDESRISRTIQRWSNLELNDIIEKIEQFGWRRNAAKSLAQKIKN